MLYPTYTVAGTALDDPQGRWNLVPGTDLLPSFPGLRNHSYSVPGAAGEIAVQHAPVLNTTRKVVVQFHAVGRDGSIASSPRERVELLSQHIGSFYSGLRMAAAGHEGLTELVYHLSEVESRVAYGRVAASAAPEYAPGNDYATLELLFEIPAGRWFSPTYDTVSFVAWAGTTSFDIPCGDAPMDDIEVNVQGDGWFLPERPLILTNEAGHGFRLEQRLAADTDWLLLRPLLWGSRSYTGTNAQWGLPATKTGVLLPQNRSQGSGLVLYPSTTEGIAKLKVTTPGGIDLQVRVRKAWF